MGFRDVKTSLGQNRPSDNRYPAIAKRDNPGISTSVFSSGTTLVIGENHCFVCVHRCWIDCTAIWPK